MKLKKQVIVAHNLYKTLHRTDPDTVIIDKGYYDALEEEMKEFGYLDFLLNMSIQIVPRMGKTEVRFYKRLKIIRLKEQKEKQDGN